MNESTATRKTITKLGNDPSKAEEISFFNEIAESIPQNSYLKDFFRREVISFVEEQIRNDFPADIWDWLNQEEKIKFYQKDLDEKTKTIFSMTEQSNDYLAVIDSLKDQTQRQSSEIIDADTKIRNLSDQAQNLRFEIIGLESKICEKDLEIIKLKARLFDLMNLDD